MSLDFFFYLPLNLINLFEILLCGLFDDQLAINLDHRSKKHTFCYQHVLYIYNLTSMLHNILICNIVHMNHAI
jgi:hypothetical protein